MSDYTFYYPDLVEEWKVGRYRDVVRILLQKNAMAISVFCCDLYHLEIDTTQNRLARLASELANLEGVEFVQSSLVLQNCLELWQENIGPNTIIQTLRSIAGILIEHPKCCLVGFISSAILLPDLDETLKHYYLGILSGTLARIGEK